MVKSQYLSSKTDTGLKSVQILYGHSFCLSLSHARDKTKNTFLYFFTELKPNHPSHSIYLTVVTQILLEMEFIHIWPKEEFSTSGFFVFCFPAICLVIR